MEQLLVSAITLVTFDGAVNWTVGFLTTVAIFAILALALNIQWSVGILNFGVAAFFMVGAYVSAVLTLPAPEGLEAYVAGWGLPIPVGWLFAMVSGAVLALLLGIPTLRLRDDFLAIATIGVAAILRSIANSVEGLVNRSRGLNGIDGFLEDQVQGGGYRWVELAIALVVLLAVYWLVTRATASPWGRTLRAIRDNEDTAKASGKNTVRFRMGAFILGAMLMGLAGAIYAHRSGTISPLTFSDLLGTFFVWTMLIVGGSGNHRGALLGAVVVGFFWFGTPLIQESLPDWLGSRVFQVRQLLIGLLIVVFLLWRPQGLLAERDRVSRFVSQGPEDSSGGHGSRWRRLRERAVAQLPRS
ncbi:MAG: branched-chain amino acid ABC transporter permease [Chloroflexi bacterium]|nr:branched-chain amino acid ABC transporter permease [Chloroflexota bacterium]MYJ58189.1 branched-chain amino acid ABC transporter permease [Chloroflexota bacterium]